MVSDSFLSGGAIASGLASGWRDDGAERFDVNDFCCWFLEPPLFRFVTSMSEIGIPSEGGFGFVFSGTYDARPNAAASRRDLKVVVKLPTTDPDAIKAFEGEMAVNKKLASFGRLPGVAEFVGTVDLRPIERQLPSGLGSKTGLVWIAVQGKTLDTFFDRGGGMSPVLASTLGVRESPPTRTAKGEVVYIKVLK